MLKQLSRLKRTQSTFIILFALILGISLIFFYAPSGGGGAVAENSTVASVGGDEIKAREILSIKERIGSDQRAQFAFAQGGGTRGLVDEIIDTRVVAAEARRLGLLVTDEELSEAIRRQFSDATGAFIGAERYKRRVGDTAQFESQVRTQLANQKLQALVTSGVQISPEEIENDYKRANTKFELVYVPVTVEKLLARMQPSDEDLANYYNANKVDFAITVPQKKIRYLYINQEKAGAKLNFSDEELQTQYNELPEDRKQAGVRAQQIVLRIARPELDEQVRAKAAQLITDLRGAEVAQTIAQERFAEVARGNSEDPATAKQGGELNGIVRRNANKPDDPLQRLLTMQPGEITEPVKIGNAYHIFRRGESVPKSFEDARQELLVSLRNRRSYAVAAQLAARANEQLKQTKNVEQVAGQFAAEANMTAQEMIRETDFIKPGDTVGDIGSNPQFEEAVQPLNNPGDVGERVGIPGGFAIPVLADKREPRTPELAEVRDQVLQKVKAEQARTRLEQIANELAGGTNNPSELRARAESLGLEVQEAKDYALGSPLGALGASAASDAAVYALGANSVARTPVKIDDEYVVIAATARQEADLTEFAKQRESLTQTALYSAQGEVFSDYTAAARRRMEEAGDVRIYDETVKELAAGDAPPMLSPRGLPAGLGGGLPPGIQLPN